MKFTVFTLFPEYFTSALECSLLGKAIQSKLFDLEIVSLRPFGEGKWHVVDDRPFGGGPGMVLMPTVLEKAFHHFFKEQGSSNPEQSVKELELSVKEYRKNEDRDLHFFTSQALTSRIKPPLLVIYLSPQGVLHSTSIASCLSQVEHIVFLCGHYEGIDERALECFVHEELSLGDFILTGGEPATLAVLDSIARFIPGVVGLKESVSGDSFGESAELPAGYLKGPTYTRPQSWREKEVPEILLSGNHQNIAEFRKSESIKRTKRRRPDLIRGAKK